MGFFLVSPVAFPPPSPHLGTCACQACDGLSLEGRERGGRRRGNKGWEVGIVGQTVVAFPEKTPAALVLPFLYT